MSWPGWALSFSLPSPGTASSGKQVRRPLWVLLIHSPQLSSKRSGQQSQVAPRLASWWRTTWQYSPSFVPTRWDRSRHGQRWWGGKVQLVREAGVWALVLLSLRTSLCPMLFKAQSTSLVAFEYLLACLFPHAVVHLAHTMSDMPRGTHSRWSIVFTVKWLWNTLTLL